jgi:23S rRNA 5-hydroxycytidine C2501 synthase
LAARPRQARAPRRGDARFPEDVLDFRGNVLNRKALAFYQRHGVVSIEAAAESGLDLRGRVVMTTRYCLKYEQGQCPRSGAPRGGTAIPEPWHLVDDEGRRLALRFRCDLRDCVMEIVYDPTR